ncbi:MAG: tRNA (adenosine(37)-N6)-threonylcarbamoyltransferase complex transferase subunit TsaD [Spirochaetes bacterium RBG_13_51_14]|nr:MAG: tRNA (adenosine(37)-N6)-threonylcarbamoyltransferase complex transferase subunit TsaD [Spirochaetes bacterium RBG_13_51_14]
MKDPLIGLGLESSCDETAAAVVRNGREILSNIISSQVDLHREYYGVVPEIASRAHLETINLIIDRALHEAGVRFGDLDYVAATSRPGLVGSLLIALQSAKVISYAMGIPLVAVNHLEAHLYAPFLEGREPVYPFIGLLVSGGNTVLYHVRGVGDLEVIGRTVDDAAGEAYDKIAKYMNLGYPGGPAIEKLARTAKGRNVVFPKILPEPGDVRFSYSGIKTAVINYLRENPGAEPAEVVFGFQERILELLTRRVFAAARARGTASIVVAGGVAANGRLREMLFEEKRPGEEIIIPSPILCTDNAAMVAGIGYRHVEAGRVDDLAVDVQARA